MKKLNKIILLVEDEEMLLNILKKGLESIGLEVFLASDGKKGLDLISKENPDLVLLDILMPNMDGIEMLKIIKNDPKLNTIPIILLTNYTDTEKMLEAKKLGVEDYLIKSNVKYYDVIDLVKEKLKIPKIPLE